jgi:hypothetical protein
VFPVDEMWISAEKRGCPKTVHCPQTGSPRAIQSLSIPQASEAKENIDVVPRKSKGNNQ